MDDKSVNPVVNFLCPGKNVLEHQILVLKGLKIRRSNFQLFLSREYGVAAPKVGTEQRMYTEHQMSQQSIALKHQKMVFINEK